MDFCVCCAEIFPEIRDLKKLLDILKCKKLRKHLTILEMKFFRNHPERNLAQMFIILMLFGLGHYINNICSLDILSLKDYGSENSTNCRYVFILIDLFSKFV